MIKIKKVITGGVLLASVCCLFYGGSNLYEVRSQQQRDTELIDLYNLDYDIPKQNEPVKGKEPTEDSYADKFNVAHEANHDFIGWLTFDSGIMNLPIVQTTDNDFYMKHNFVKEYSTRGNPCMDYNQTMDCKNLTIYGHLIYADEQAMFSPLSQFTEQSYFNANKYFKFSSETEIRTYQIVSVFIHDPDQPSYYTQSTFTEGDWNNYIHMLNNKRLYDTGVAAKAVDRFMALQTCIKGKEGQRLIVVGKEINKENVH